MAFESISLLAKICQQPMIYSCIKIVKDSISTEDINKDFVTWLVKATPLPQHCALTSSGTISKK